MAKPTICPICNSAIVSVESNPNVADCPKCGFAYVEE